MRRKRGNNVSKPQPLL